MKNLCSMNFLSEIDDRKERKKVESFFKTNVLVPNTKMCEDGATVAATPTFSLAKQCGQSRAGRTGSLLHRSIQISGKLPLNTANVLPS